MNKNPQSTIILSLSLPLAFLIIACSYIGLFVPGTYSKETSNWTAQAIGQDAVDLFLISPMLVITAILAARMNTIGRLLWSGVLLYIMYTYAIYCFDVHFNSLFFAYCLVFGLSLYSFVYFLFSQTAEPVKHWPENRLPAKIVGVYLIVIACLFYALWLSQILPAIISNSTPRDLVDVGLPTNPVHVIDLSVALPGIFTVGLLLLKKKPLGLLLAPGILMFTVLMDITIGALIVAMHVKAIQEDYIITVVMTFLALISALFLIIFLRDIKDSV